MAKQRDFEKPAKHVCNMHYDMYTQEIFYCCDASFHRRNVCERSGNFGFYIYPRKDNSPQGVYIQCKSRVLLTTILGWFYSDIDQPKVVLLYKRPLNNIMQKVGDVFTGRGQGICLPDKYDIQVCDRILEEERVATWPAFAQHLERDPLRMWRLQNDWGPFNCLNNRSKKFIIQKILAALQPVGNKHGWIYNLFENWYLTFRMLSMCQTPHDIYSAVQASYKMFTGESLNLTMVNALFGPQVNVQADFNDVVVHMRNALNGVSAFADSPILRKFTKLYSLLLSKGFLKHLGLEITEKEHKAIYKRYKEDGEVQNNIIYCIFDSAVFVCERVVDFRATGHISSFIHTENSYSLWIKDADKVLALAPFTSNLVAHNTTYFSFISDLNDAIQRGSTITAYSRKVSGVESGIISRKLAQLQNVKNMEITRRSTQKERTAPLGVLIHGGSSVGKSSFSKMLFYHFAGVHGLEKEDHFRYVRNPADEYWSNFDTSKWCIHLDDIACFLPDKQADVDPTVKEMLNVINNVPYVPPQAHLEDKGMTPVLAKLVVATTNVGHINAHEYFQCPLAVRRRLPYVIHLKPKDKYLHPNGKFLDPRRLPENHTGFPDWWVITVQRIKPIMHQGRESAVFDKVEVFEHVADFLKHFGKFSVEFEEQQKDAMNNDKTMANIEVCQLCYSETRLCNCVQAEWSGDWMCKTILRVIAAVFYYDWLSNLILDLCKYRYIRHSVLKMLNFANHPRQIAYHARLNVVTKSEALKYALMAFSALSTTLVAFKVLSSISTSSEPDEDQCASADVVAKTQIKPTTVRPPMTENEYQDFIKWRTEKFLGQGSALSHPFEVDGKENVWYKKDVELDQFVMPRASISTQAMTPEDIRDYVAPNCVRLNIKCLDTGTSCRTGGFFIRGHMLLTNRHVLMGGMSYRITIDGGRTDGIRPTITVELHRRDIQFDAMCDLACVQILCTPPYRDLSRYWVAEPISFQKALAVRRDNAGCVEYNIIHGVSLCEQFPIESLNIITPTYIGISTSVTKPGDCGGIVIALTPRGFAIVGIHTIGYDRQCGFPQVNKMAVDKLIMNATVQETVGTTGAPIFKVGESAKCVSQDFELQGDRNSPLMPPHRKSLVRFIQDGSGKYYGTMPGFRAASKSRVCDTPICEEVLDFFKIQRMFGQPAMSGWEPWRKNLVHMVQPVVNYDRRTMQLACRSFFQEIVDMLPHGWQRELPVLTRKASVNGIPGVQYIDRINCSSSMGHPWNTSKKKYLVPDICEEYPDGVTFVDEVWAETERLETLYKGGDRGYPIFTAHLKDEPTLLSKCADKKTRVFTGASVPYSLIVRKYLLPFVRLVQRNKFAFESGPGTVVQSTEWGDVYAYLTKYGNTRMIAGDYGKFDKKMIADFVLMAFDLIAKFYEAAGADETTLRVIRAIATDTAFPLVDFNGDVIEFFGTNPSGHPLTVIINCIVNCLYMRYVFYTLSPDRSKRFKDYVRLFTYGDDNVMGVHEDAPWFTHTSVQSVLASIGVEYTMADKEAASIPYIHINDCSFLKRRWVYNDDLEVFLAPIEMESVYKMLTSWIPSRSVCMEVQLISVIQSANLEMFFHGKHVFEKNYHFFKYILSREPYSHYCDNETLPDWHTLVRRFWKASGIEDASESDGSGSSSEDF